MRQQSLTIQSQVEKTTTPSSTSHQRASLLRKQSPWKFDTKKKNSEKIDMILKKSLWMYFFLDYGELWWILKGLWKIAGIKRKNFFIFFNIFFYFSIAKIGFFRGIIGFFQKTFFSHLFLQHPKNKKRIFRKITKILQ